MLLEFLASLKPRILVEIGTADGGTLFLFSTIAAPDAVIISVDIRNLAYRRALYHEFIGGRQEVRLLRGHSHSEEMLRSVKAILGNDLIDFLFIDSDHTYEAVKKDFELYWPLVRQGGVIAFHDIVKYPPGTTDQEVNEFWTEIKEGYGGIEIVTNPKQDWGELASSSNLQL